MTPFVLAHHNASHCVERDGRGRVKARMSVEVQELESEANSTLAAAVRETTLLNMFFHRHN